MRSTEFTKTLLEANMSPTVLQQWAASPAAKGIRCGLEFEFVIPGSMVEYNDLGEPDYDADSGTYSIFDVCEFFSFNGVNSPVIIRNLRRALTDEFNHHLKQLAETMWEDKKANNPNFRTGKESFVNKFMTDPSKYVNVSEQEAKWISAAYTFMTDIHNNFSMVEWPHLSDNDPVDVTGVADLISKVVGTNVIVSDAYHSESRDTSSWILEPDSSITPSGTFNIGSGPTYDVGRELISPPLMLPDALAAIDAIYKWASEVGVYSNQSTGLHINISVPNPTSLDYLKMLIFSGDGYIKQQFGREASIFCKSVLAQIRQDLSLEKPVHAKSFEQIATYVREQLTNLATSSIVAIARSQRYASVLIRNGYVEFRSPGGYYLEKDISQLQNTILRYAMAMQLGSDPAAYRTEYLKKLYKLIASDMETVDAEIMQLFVKFTTGNITLAGLKDQWAYINAVSDRESQSSIDRYPNISKKIEHTKQMIN
jgi:hypothetical protein